MKQFYLERTNLKENQLKMARVGYLSRIRDLGTQLVSCTVKESYEILKQLTETVEAYKELENEYSFTLERYQEEALKGASDKGEKNG